MAEPVVAEAAVFELARFEWAAPDRIEVEGRWSGLRGHRFIRPTLVLHAEGEEPRRRLLASLEHKPWSADDEGNWIAAFAFDGEGPVKFESAEMNVAPGIDLTLPAPRMRPGPSRRFRRRIEVRDASADDAAPAAPAVAAVSTGIVSDPPAEPAPADPDAPAADAPTADPPAPNPELERLRAARNEARRERDDVLDKLRALRKELEEERHARETAVAEARAAERASANSMLSQGAELRAAVERQRALAYEARDEALKQRDAAISARDRACAERDEARRLKKEAERERDAALSAAKRADSERDRASQARNKALEDLERANHERDAALAERDSIVSIHERGLPVVAPKPRFRPAGDQRSDLEIWMPRATALGILLLFAVIVLRLFAGV